MIHVRALGPVEVTVDGAAAPTELMWRKHLALLVYLARSPRRTRTREHLTTLLWGEKPEQAARHSLREAVRVLRRALGEALADEGGESLHLAEGSVTLDVNRFEQLASEGDWAGAAGLALGEFLEGFAVGDAPAFEDWVAGERLAVRRREVDVLVRRAAELESRGDLAASAECARRATMLQPDSEPACRALMSALTLAGDRAAALDVLERLSQRLRENVGAEPEAATRQLAERIRQERLARPAQAAPPQGAESRRTPLIGREAELAALLAWWHGCVRGPRATAAFIEGESGVGKSRLGEELAARARLDGAATVGVRAAPADRDQPWSGVFAIARSGLAQLPGVAAAPPGALATFAARIEDWGDRFSGARGAEPMAPGAALTEVVRAAAAERPVLLELDDAHWLDAESLLAAGALLRDLAALPVMVALTVAPIPEREELDALRGRLGRDVPGGTIRVERLGGASLRALVLWALPSWGDAEQDRLARRLSADSAGLPLLAVELLHAVALGLDLHGSPTAWPEEHRTLDQSLPGDLPETVVAAIRIGFRRLSKDAQAVLAAAAVIGDHVATDALALATGLDVDRLTAALDEAEWQRWLHADARGYGFVARIAREVVARDMVLPGQRQRILRQVRPHPSDPR